MHRTFRHFLEMIRFSHTVFALPFALLAALMAWKVGSVSHPPISWRWQDLIGILVCMVTARSAAMAANRIADRRYDAANARTASRHLPAGHLSVRAAFIFAVGSAALFVAGTMIFLPRNPLPLYLAVPVLLFITAYSYTKRFTSLTHFWLGAALMLAPICAWIAIRGDIVVQNPADLLPAVLLGGAVLLWVAGFDIIYACQDFQFDQVAGLHSVPSRVGIPRALHVATICHVGSVALLLVLPIVFPYIGWIYWGGVAAIAVLLAYEHAIVKPDDLTRVNIAFFNVNALISFGLLCITTLDLLV